MARNTEFINVIGIRLLVCIHIHLHTDTRIYVASVYRVLQVFNLSAWSVVWHVTELSLCDRVHGVLANNNTDKKN